MYLKTGHPCLQRDSGGRKIYRNLQCNNLGLIATEGPQKALKVVPMSRDLWSKSTKNNKIAMCIPVLSKPRDRDGSYQNQLITLAWLASQS